MKNITIRSATRLTVAAGLLIIASSAFSATGFTTTTAQATQVTAGMSRDEVSGLMGQPKRNVQYQNEPGRTWTYAVLGNDVAAGTVFDVDFDSAGTVLASGERIETISK